MTRQSAIDARLDAEERELVALIHHQAGVHTHAVRSLLDELEGLRDARMLLSRAQLLERVDSVSCYLALDMVRQTHLLAGRIQHADGAERVRVAVAAAFEAQVTSAG